MAEAACVIHAFTFPPYEAKKVDELHESISFGRFATETLAWDNWSSFSSKRYVEEAAKHSQPGLVASKKAFFEAYYKKKGFLEKKNTDEENYTEESNAEDGNINGTHPTLETAVSELQETSDIQVNVDTIVVSEPLNARHQEASKMELLRTCNTDNEGILREVTNDQRVPEVSDGKFLSVACPPPPSVLKVSSKRAYSVKGPRVSFGISPVDITLSDSSQHNVSVAEVFPTSKVSACLMLKPSATACIEAKRYTLNHRVSRRVQFQTKIKEKAASQLKKLRQSFCFCSISSTELQNKSQALK